MGRYDALKHPFSVAMGNWAYRKTNDSQERQPKSMPCHVTKVEKDFITVAFETQNGIFTPPTVKIPQSMAPYGRNPTQVGDKGYAVPGHYYLGGVTGDAGGNTDFYPRGNLTTLSFEHTSHKQNPDRDVDQLTHMGGPNGWIVGSFQKQQDQQNGGGGGNGGGGQSAATAMLNLRRSSTFRDEQRKLRAYQQAGIPGIPPPIAGLLPPQVSGIIDQISGLIQQVQQIGQQVQKDLTQFSFDKEFKALVQSVDADHNLTVDQKNKTVSLTSSQTIYHDPKDGKVLVGGNPQNKFARIMT